MIIMCPVRVVVTHLTPFFVKEQELYIISPEFVLTSQNFALCQSHDVHSSMLIMLLLS